MTTTWSLTLAAAFGLVLMVTACGGSDGAVDVSGDEDNTASSVDVVDDESGSVRVEDDEPIAVDEASEAGAASEAETAASDSDAESGSGSGVILADLCAGDQFLNGAIPMSELVALGFFTSDDVVVDGSGVLEASAYETFGFLCNMSEAAGDGENFLTVGVQSGSGAWDLAAEQGDATIETMGDWEVIVGSNWLSPLTMRYTDEAGQQDSLFVLWTPADGSIPDAATLERLMRPLGEAIAERSIIDIPRS